MKKKWIFIILILSIMALTIKIAINKSYSLTEVATPESFKVVKKDYASVTLSWKKVSNVSGYQMHMINTNTNLSYDKEYSSSTTTATRSGLVPGDTYKFTIRAFKTVNGERVYSKYSQSQGETTVPISSPSNLKATSVVQNTAKLTWTKATDVDGYVLSVYEGTKLTQELKCASNSTTKTNLKPGTTYTFKVRAYKEIKDKTRYSSYSLPETLTTEPTLDDNNSTQNNKTPAKIQDLSAKSVTSKKANLAWTADKAASGYEIVIYKRKVSGGKATYTKDKTLTSTTNSIQASLSEATIYRYQVRGYNAKKTYGEYSEYHIIKTLLDSAAPVIKLKDKTETSASISWNDTGSKKYKLTITNADNSETDTSVVTFKDKKSTYTYKFKDLKEYTNYKIKIQTAKDKDDKEFYSSYSNILQVQTVKPQLYAPTNFKNTQIDYKEASFSWSPVAGADGYELLMLNKRTGKEYTKTVNGGAATSTTKKSMLSNNEYDFKLRAFKKSGGSNVYSSYASIPTLRTKKLATPTNITKENVTLNKDGISNVELSWNNVADATGYIVEMKNTKTNKIYESKVKTNHINRGKIGYKNTDYEFRVKAYKTIGDVNITSDYSTIKKVRTKYPVSSKASTAVAIAKPYAKKTAENKLKYKRGAKTMQLDAKTNAKCDCSIFVNDVIKKTFKLENKFKGTGPMPRTSLDQSKSVGVVVTKEIIEPGDLIFFKWNEKAKANGMQVGLTHHVGMYIGDAYNPKGQLVKNAYIHCTHGTTASGVYISSLDKVKDGNSDIAVIRRVLNKYEKQYGK